MRFHFGRNEIFSISVSVQFPVTVYMIQPAMKLIVGAIHCGHFDRNEVSFRVIKYHVNTTRNETI